MLPDDHVCLCFHVSKRKLTNFLRIEKPTRASQLSQCQGAGTGCGWCVPFLKRMFQTAQQGDDSLFPEPNDYARQREAYIRYGKGSPPS